MACAVLHSLKSSLVTNPDTSMTNKVTGHDAIASRASARGNGRRKKRPMLLGWQTLMHCPHTRQSVLALSFAGLSRLGQLRASNRVRLQARTQSLPVQAAHLLGEVGRTASIAPRPYVPNSSPK